MGRCASFLCPCDRSSFDSYSSDEPAKVYGGAIECWDRTFNRPHQVLPKLLAEIRDATVDFVFFGGDNIDCYQPQTAQRIVHLARQDGLEVCFESGNHDWEAMHTRYATHDYDALLRTETLKKLQRHWNTPRRIILLKKGVRFIVLDPPYMNMRVNGEWRGKFDVHRRNGF